jgi:hypothetical protein
MMQTAARAKSLILEWFDESGQPTAMRGKVSSGIDRFLDHIVKRDSWFECITILLDDYPACRFRASGRDWRIVSTKQGPAVSTIVPGWGFGWRPIFRDEYVYDLLSWLGHYARQYVHRSHVARALMIAWERNGAVLHPFGSQMQLQRYGVPAPPPPPRTVLSNAAKQSVIKWGEVELSPRSRSRWTRRNTVDPAIHQAIFHFLRGQTLIASGFEIEALVAFDCVLQSLQAIEWNSPVGNPKHSRSDLVATLGLHSNDGELAKHIYFLRNQFAAHAGGWRWWDVGEYADNELMEMASNLALCVLQRAADAEPAARRVDPEPTDWGIWLLESFPLLFPAIWFQAKG